MTDPLGIEYGTWITGMGITQLLLAAVIVLLAFIGYRRNNSRAMLYLSGGIATLTMLPVLTRYIFQSTIGIQNSTLLALGFETLGLILILYAIIIARRS